MLRISRILSATQAEGPGFRTAVWFQGCSIRCAGCINPHLFSPKGGFDLSVNQIIQIAIDSGDEGLTLLGGEPLDQLEKVIILASEARKSGLGVICFTGYEYESLQFDSRYSLLFENLDLLVDGPYIADSPEIERPLIGSTNQRFIYLSDRYVDENLEGQKNRLEFRVSREGTSEVAGFLNTRQLDKLKTITKTIRRVKK